MQKPKRPLLQTTAHPAKEQRNDRYHTYLHIFKSRCSLQNLSKNTRAYPTLKSTQFPSAKVEYPVITLREVGPFCREWKCRFQSCDIKVVGSKTRFGLKISHLEWLAILVYGLHRKLSTIHLYCVGI